MDSLGNELAKKCRDYCETKEQKMTSKPIQMSQYASENSFSPNINNHQEQKIEALTKQNNDLKINLQ